MFYAFEPPQDQPNYDEYMAEVEVRAAHNVLEACAQTDTIDKVVFTSSVTAGIWRDDRKSLESDFDERHWSNVNFCRKYKVVYKQIPRFLYFLASRRRENSFPPLSFFTVAKEYMLPLAKFGMACFVSTR